MIQKLVIVNHYTKSDCKASAENIKDAYYILFPMGVLSSEPNQ